MSDFEKLYEGIKDWAYRIDPSQGDMDGFDPAEYMHELDELITEAVVDERERNCKATCECCANNYPNYEVKTRAHPTLYKLKHVHFAIGSKDSAWMLCQASKIKALEDNKAIPEH